MQSLTGKPSHRTLAALVALLATLSLPAAASAGSEPPNSLLSSSAPKKVLLNTTTDTIESVTPLSQAEYEALQIAAGETPATPSLQPAITRRNGCDTGDGCYYAWSAPYANYGFYGSSGTYHGTMPHRGGFDTGKYNAFACWTGACSSTLPPKTYVKFTNQVTGTAFWIS